MQTPNDMLKTNSLIDSTPIPIVKAQTKMPDNTHFIKQRMSHLVLQNRNQELVLKNKMKMLSDATNSKNSTHTKFGKIGDHKDMLSQLEEVIRSPEASKLEIKMAEKSRISSNLSDW